MSIKDKINSLIGNFEDETIVDEGNSNNQESASSLASDSLELKKQKYNEAKRQYESKIKEVDDNYKKKKSKIESKISDLNSKRNRLEKSLKNYRNNLVNAEMNDQENKVSKLNKRISGIKNQLRKVEEKMENYTEVNVKRVEPEVKKEILVLYKAVQKSGIELKRAAHEKEDELKEFKKELEKTIEDVSKIWRYKVNNTPINSLSKLEKLMHNRGYVHFTRTRNKESMYKLWLENNHNYKKYLPNQKKTKEISKRKINMQTGEVTKTVTKEDGSTKTEKYNM